ncbi:porin family protein [Emcibacter nanhaiensis]|uniref:Porin family protein n=1 Tax=Emcibacter nanhaiensis TaxID=1505037 RepID=A0A501PN18_9PROT|nr:porin family protein [Emcibacter nanhaiensis]TPD61558.1 porin family protein [Emcibacter nanhaiensis]
MKKTLISFAAAAVLAGTVSAQAEDSVFAGPYAGLEIGYNDFNYDAGPVDASSDGFTYGGFAGYRYQLDSSILLGAEARIGESTASVDGGSSVTIDFGRQLGIDATVGTTFGEQDDILAFAFVGYENLRATAHYAGEKASSDLDGIRFGVGGEYAFADNLSLRATFAYTDYENDVRNIQLLTGLVYNF